VGSGTRPTQKQKKTKNNSKKKIIFLIFLVKNSLCIFVNLRICFLFLKTSWGPHFFSYTHNFFCEVLKDPK
jgi:hypothetical protein